MIKVANNLTNLCAVKASETSEVEAATQKALAKIRKKEQKEDVPVEDREVDYAGRARRGALHGAIPGALLGALLGAAGGRGWAGYGKINPERTNALIYGNSVDGLPPYIDEPSTGEIIAKTLGGAGIGALGGGLLGGAAGAFGNAASGYVNEDLITRRAEPNRLRRALMGALAGAPIGTLTGINIGLASRAGADEALAVGGGLGALGGAGLGALTSGVIEPWLNKDMYSQKYLENK